MTPETGGTTCSEMGGTMTSEIVRMGRFNNALQILENVEKISDFDEAIHLKRHNLLTKLSENGDPSLGVVHDRI